MTTTTTQQAQPMTSDAITRNVIGRVINAIAADDWTGLAAVISPTVVYWRPGTKDRVDGAQAYLEQWQNLDGQQTRLKFTPHTVIIQGDTGVVEATARAVSSDGTVCTYSMVSIMRVQSGRLVEEREYIVERGVE